MRRFLTWAFNFTAAVSAVLFLATCALWPYSYWFRDEVERDVWSHGDLQSYQLRSSMGTLMIAKITKFMPNDGDQWDGTPCPIPGGGLKLYQTRPGEDPRAGPEFTDGSFGDQRGFRHIVVKSKPIFRPEFVPDFAMEFSAVTFPIWVLVTPLSLLPASWLLCRWRRSRCPRLGLCLFCGYDLRATLERCPECGTVSPRV